MVYHAVHACENVTLHHHIVQKLKTNLEVTQSQRQYYEQGGTIV